MTQHAGLAVDAPVLVTGAGGGLGAALCHAFAERGTEPVLLGRSGANLEEVAASVALRLGRPVDFYVADVSDFQAMAAIAREIGGRHAALAGLINNAGIIDPIAPLTQADAALWARNIAVNLVGPFNVIRAVADLIPAGGFVVNISSGAADSDHMGWSAYAAAKAGLERLTSTFQAERPDLRVEYFRPGVTASRMQQIIRASSVDNAIRRLPEDALQPPEKPAQALVQKLLGAAEQ